MSDSRCIAPDIAHKVVSDRLGHSTIGITADLYTHMTKALDQEAASRLDDLLKRPTS